MRIYKSFMLLLCTLVSAMDGLESAKSRWPFNKLDTNGEQAVIVTRAVDNNPRPCPLERHESPIMYYHLGSFGKRFERKCPNSLVFSAADCACAFPVNVVGCSNSGMTTSSLGPRYYQQYAANRWVTMECAPGTMYNKSTCRCDIHSAIGQRKSNWADGSIIPG